MVTYFYTEVRSKMRLNYGSYFCQNGRMEYMPMPLPPYMPPRFEAKNLRGQGDTLIIKTPGYYIQHYYFAPPLSLSVRNSG